MPRVDREHTTHHAHCDCVKGETPQEWFARKVEGYKDDPEYLRELALIEHGEVVACEARIRELEEAQRPFVLWAKAFMELFPDKADDWTYAGLTVGPDGTGQALTMGDLRRIAALADSLPAEERETSMTKDEKQPISEYPFEETIIGFDKGEVTLDGVMAEFKERVAACVAEAEARIRVLEEALRAIYACLEDGEDAQRREGAEFTINASGLRAAFAQVCAALADALPAEERTLALLETLARSKPSGHIKLAWITGMEPFAVAEVQYWSSGGEDYRLRDTRTGNTLDHRCTRAEALALLAGKEKGDAPKD